MEGNMQNENPTEVGTTKQATYEQLLADNRRLVEIRKQLIERMQMMDLSNAFKRLEILFKVIENAEMFSQEFVDNCVKEIEDLVTIPKTAEPEENQIKEE